MAEDGVGPAQPGRPVRDFVLEGPGGEPLAWIGFRPGRVLPWPRRKRWTVRLASGARYVGRSGTWYAWLWCVLLFPVWAPLWLVLSVASWWEGGTLDGAGKPGRVRWFGSGPGTGSGWVMDRRDASGFRFRPRRLDARVAYGLALATEWSESS
ncbi:hypothetical protein [Streptomyces sp. HNM0574]|uniref:hypothetical protein n=1 Tax=Streptomyces sp. HNM0574 TaxID=2714954 RepID=UPI00146DEAB7|nr:hypothetical protein [Streptomyces sp. HNM0574]NLU68577.1 hypothetical protein [Streptomyces sp. HNM0574]